MSVLRPSFPPDVARALQQPEGEVSFRYTLSERLQEPQAMDRMLMETPYERVLVALVLDTKRNLRFIRTGSRAEGARVALVNVETLMDARHWDVWLRWDAETMTLRVRDQDDPREVVLEGTHAWG